jgi:hypothetical protein
MRRAHNESIQARVVDALAISPHTTRTASLPTSDIAFLKKEDFRRVRFVPEIPLTFCDTGCGLSTDRPCTPAKAGDMQHQNFQARMASARRRMRRPVHFAESCARGICEVL